MTSRTALTICLLTFSCASAHAQSQESTTAPRQGHDVTVRSLRSSLVKPAKKGTSNGQYIIYPADYDWAEHRRVLEAIDALVRDPDGAFRALTEGMADNEYCLTVAVDRAVFHYSVADVCADIINDAVTCPYMKFIPPGQESYLALRKPAYIPSLNPDVPSGVRNNCDREIRCSICKSKPPNGRSRA
jgi:hypothetical protein